MKVMEKDYGRYALLMKALSDDTRVKIFDMLSKGELCACNILEAFHITQPTLSYHMKILIESGLVSGRKDGVWTKYTINAESLKLVKEFFDGIDLSLGSENRCCSAK